MYASEKQFASWFKTEFVRQVSFLKVEGFKQQPPGVECAPDFIITAMHGNDRYCFIVEIKRAGYPQYIRSAIASMETYRKNHPDCYPIVAVPRIGEQGKKICEQYKVGYFDATGNVKIVSGSIAIEKECPRGKPAPLFIKTENQRQTLFSPKASRITKCILSQPDRKWFQKDLVAATGLSKGMVSRIVARLSEAGYVIKEKKWFTISNFDDLLSAWADTYAKRRQAVRRYYIWSRDPRKLMRSIAEKLKQKNVRYAFTQEAGASLVAPFSTFEIVSLYIESFDKFPAISLSAEEARRGFNVILFEPVDAELLKQARSINNMRVVDDFQLYLDLMENPLRGKKQAEHLLSAIQKKLL